MPGGRMQREAAPPAAHVEDPLPFRQPELRADQLKLGLLRLFQRPGPAREAGTAVGHRGIEKQREEVVADVVVVADRASVARERVALAAQSQLGGRRSRRQGEPAGPHQRPPQQKLLAQAQRRRFELIDDPQRSIEIVDLEQPGDVRTADAKLAGSPQHMGQNWGKRSIGLDVRDEQDRKVILALARRADVIIENQLAGFWASQGVDFAALRDERAHGATGASSRSMRAGSTRTTSQARPISSIRRMIPAEGSICQRRSPWR